MRPLRLLLWPAGAAVGLAAEWVLFGWDDPRHWVPDLTTGWTLIACGLIGWSRRANDHSGALMTATGFAWFAANFTATGVGAINWLSEHALYLHRGPLVQLVLTYPRGTPAGRIERVAVAAGYGAGVITSIWLSKQATLVLAGLLVVVAARGYLRAVGHDRRARLYTVQASALLGVVLAGIAAVRLAFPTQPTEPTRLAYEATLCVLAISLLAGLMRTPWERAAVTDLVVELGETRSANLRDALARALGDPSLSVGYWLPEQDAYVDTSGRRLDLPSPSADENRRVTRIDRDGQPLVALVHDPGVLEDPGLVEAVAAAARLAAANARLQADVRAQVDEVAASRRRLVHAGDEERRRLEERLSGGAERRLSGVLDRLDHVLEGRHPDDETIAKVGRAQTQLAQTLSELRELAAGLHPRELALGGLPGALASLAERSPVAVRVTAPPERLPAEIEETLYFVCSEALANVAKYASASFVDVGVAVIDARVRLDIEDDGIGGADPTRGTGLRGLADRVEALGGSFMVESPPGGGTRLSAELPLEGQTA
jgi:signal transduction histidine kinase